MATGGRIPSSAVDAGFTAADGVSGHLQRVSDGFREFRAMLTDGKQSIGVQKFLVTLVGAIRRNDDVGDWSRRDVYLRARHRWRRLGLLSFGTGSLAGVATQLTVLYCEVATCAT
jgi:hypothetical protein